MKIDISNILTPGELAEIASRIEAFFSLKRGSLSDTDRFRPDNRPRVPVQDATVEVVEVEVVCGERARIIEDVARLYRVAAMHYGDVT